MNAPIATAEILRWEEPAPLRAPELDLTPIADTLRANPGKSAVIAENPNTKEGRRLTTNLVSAIKYRRRGFLHPEGTFDTHTRTIAAADGSKVIHVYAVFKPRG